MIIEFVNLEFNWRKNGFVYVYLISMAFPLLVFAKITNVCLLIIFSKSANKSKGQFQFIIFPNKSG